MHREKELTPKLEEAAKLDPKNLPLQYALADHYHKIGQVEKAEQIYKALLAAQPTAEGYSALAASLLKRRKAEPLLRLFTELRERSPQALTAVEKQFDAASKDPELVSAMIDVGFKLFSTDPTKHR